MDGEGHNEGHDADQAAGESRAIRVRRQTSAKWPEKGALSKAMEEDGAIRNSFRANRSQLLAWPSPNLVGVASLKALGLNVHAVGLALQIWGSCHSTPKTMPIDWLKEEACAD